VPATAGFLPFRHIPSVNPEVTAMVPHTYLEHGLSVLHARLRTPQTGSSPGATPEVRPFLTLSRETGAGASTLGRELVPLLEREFTSPGHPWVLLDRDLLTHALTHHQLPTNLAAFLPEDRVSEIRAAIGELVGLHPSLWQLEQQVAEAILQLAHVGHVIFVGRAAHLVTRDVPGGLHVRLVAPLDTRIARVGRLLGCDADRAAAHVAEHDEARRRYVRKGFSREIDDPREYDLVINTDRVAPPAAARLVLAALRDRLAADREAVVARTAPVA
jgi:cytidylate kinase